MQSFDLIIFDLDGTLVDSQHDLASAVNHARSLYALKPLSVREIRSFVGDGVKALMERALPGLNEGQIEAAVMSFKQYYGEHLLDSTVLYPGAREMLEKLSAVRKAVLTNKTEKYARMILRGLGAEGYFDMISGGDTHEKKKPDPAPIIEMIESLKAAKGRACMLGDGRNDILAAKAAGIACGAASYGYTDLHELSALSPDFIFHSFEQLTERFTGK